MTGRDVTLAVTDVRKAFGGTQALAGVSFALQRGTIHALLGGNGSGKSTLIKILAGVHSADAGEIEIAGERFPAASMTSAHARDAGLRFVHQQQSTFPEMTVAENLAIDHGLARRPLGRIRWGRLRRRTEEVLARFEIDAGPDEVLANLGPAKQAMVAIARALQAEEDGSTAVLVLDEPTASLPAHEVDVLLAALRRYAADGQTILYVTHRLDEVLEIADRATVLRDGRVERELERSAFSHDSLVEAILGGRALQLVADGGGHAGAPVLEVRELGAGRVSSASFDVRAGEIVGLAGLLGSGRSSLLRCLYGVLPPTQGGATLEGRPLSLAGTREAIGDGVAYIPEDRLGEAAFPELSLLENIGMADSRSWFRGGRMRHRAEREAARDLIASFGIKVDSERAPFMSMSGGNQQKTVLARWMRLRPRLLLLDEPTQGVDVGARAEIWQLVRSAVAGDAAALVVSSDFEELALVCDRVLVLRDGRVAAELTGDDITQDHIVSLTVTGEEAQ